MNAITAVYRLTCDYGEVERLSRDIAVEQTVEVPESLLCNQQVSEAIVGRVENIELAADGSDAFDVTIAYNPDLSAYQIGQTLNLVYGNISLKRDIRLIGLDFPEQFLLRFRGPNCRCPSPLRGRNGSWAAWGRGACRTSIPAVPPAVWPRRRRANTPR